MDAGILSSKLILIAAAGGGVLLVIAVLAGVVMLMRKPKTHAIAKGPPKFSLSDLPASPPDTSQPHVMVYDTPVRIQYLVLAPVGAGGVAPDPSEYRKILSGIDTGLADVIQRDQVQIVTWPPQVSAIGFCQSFFNQTSLPGRGGQGTNWCAVAGKVNVFGRLLMCGMVGYSASPNGLGEITLDQEGQWHGILRIGQSS